VLNLCNTKITNEDVAYLKNCHTLNLSWTKITDVIELKNCHTLNLIGTDITDFSGLKNCHTLNLSWTKITDECIKMLRLNGVKVY
jgi:hypothetical protein